MGNFRYIPQETKDEVLKRIKDNGETVSKLAAEHGINVRTIYGWLKKGVSSSVSALEHARLKRENKILLELVGKLTLQNNLKKS